MSKDTFSTHTAIIHAPAQHRVQHRWLGRRAMLPRERYESANLQTRRFEPMMQRRVSMAHGIGTKLWRSNRHIRGLTLGVTAGSHSPTLSSQRRAQSRGACLHFVLFKPRGDNSGPPNQPFRTGAWSSTLCFSTPLSWQHRAASLSKMLRAVFGGNMG